MDKDFSTGENIDFIFTSGFDNDSATYSVVTDVSRDAKGKVTSLSDHRPVIVSNLKQIVY